MPSTSYWEGYTITADSYNHISHFYETWWICIQSIHPHYSSNSFTWNCLSLFYDYSIAFVAMWAKIVNHIKARWMIGLRPLHTYSCVITYPRLQIVPRFPGGTQLIMRSQSYRIRSSATPEYYAWFCDLRLARGQRRQAHPAAFNASRRQPPAYESSGSLIISVCSDGATKDNQQYKNPIVILMKQADHTMIRTVLPRPFQSVLIFRCS